MSFNVVSRMFRKATFAVYIATFASISLSATLNPSLVHDIVLRGGIIYDGSGNAPFPGEVAVDGDRIYSAVDQKPKSGNYLKRLRNVGENPWVTMLADQYCDDWDTLWWVRADGRAVVLSDQRSMAEPLRLLAERYWQYREAPPTGPVLAVTVERWSGWAAVR